MAYKVLYRKYRPMFFHDVVGQPQVTVTLQNELMAGRISHAYLFTGSRGTGKTTCAKILAKAVNCLHLENGDPCGKCEACQSLDNGSMMDVVEIDAASNNGVDSIRDIIDESSFTPASAKYRVYIIDEVHMLSPAASNALLKTLEEPPAHVIFILATTEVHKILPTIISRLQRFDFKRITPLDIAERLTYVCEKENVSIEKDAALSIARIADGGLRDALSILDQCIGHADHITANIVNETAGIVGNAHLFQLAQAIKNQESAKAIEIIDDLYQNSKDISKLCEELSSHFRKLMLIKTMQKPETMMMETDEEMEKLKKQAYSISLATVLHTMDVFRNSLDKMKYANQRIELEMAFIKLCSPELDFTPEALIRRIETLEQGNRTVKIVKEKEEKIEVATESIETVEETPDASYAPPQSTPQVKRSVDNLSKDAVRFNRWPEVIQIMKQYSRSVAATFEKSAAYTSGNYMLISGSKLAFDLLKNSSQRDKMKEAIYKVTGQNYNLGPYKGDEKEVVAQSDPMNVLKERAIQSGIKVDETNNT